MTGRGIRTLVEREIVLQTCMYSVCVCTKGDILLVRDSFILHMSFCSYANRVFSFVATSTGQLPTN